MLKSGRISAIRKALHLRKRLLALGAAGCCLRSTQASVSTCPCARHGRLQKVRSLQGDPYAPNCSLRRRLLARSARLGASWTCRLRTHGMDRLDMPASPAHPDSKVAEPGAACPVSGALGANSPCRTSGDVQQQPDELGHVAHSEQASVRHARRTQGHSWFCASHARCTSLELRPGERSSGTPRPSE